jgi:hypothetical protein
MPVIAHPAPYNVGDRHAGTDFIKKIGRKSHLGKNQGKQRNTRENRQQKMDRRAMPSPLYRSSCRIAVSVPHSVYR